jgi:predicted nucleic acid-binding protein
MKSGIITDTGPLVAYLSKCDTYHTWTCNQLEQISLPLLTCEAVLTEACFLVSRNGGEAEDLIYMLSQGWLSIPFSLLHESKVVGELMRKYADIPMSLADGCRLRMTELLPNSQLLTLDEDFSIYRKNGKEAVPVIMPDKRKSRD